MPFLITGGEGQLGRELICLLRAKGIETISPSRLFLDITSKGKVREVFGSGQRIEAVIHSAALTDVDCCELRQDLAYQVNVLGTRYLALEAARQKIPFVYLSTDYVFDGRRDRPYKEDDTPNPINFYGLSKLAGEREVISIHPSPLIIRTSWLFGIGGHNFMQAILDRAYRGEILEVVDDEIGLPTYARDLAAYIIKLLKVEAPKGVYHVANRGLVSRYDLAKRVLKEMGLTGEIKAIHSHQLKRVARRPSYSVFSLEKVKRYLKPAFYGDGLQEYLQELKMKRFSMNKKEGNYHEGSYPGWRNRFETLSLNGRFE